jgi:sec-independent protein translocase protein TatC
VANEGDTNFTRMTISEHLEELRTRLIRSLLAIAVVFGFAFWQIDWVVTFMKAPLEALDPEFLKSVETVQSKVYGGFFGAMKLAFFAGCVGAAPVLLFQIWMFVAAGLYSHERRMVKYYAIPGFLLFLGGAFVAYAFVMPYAFRFLIGFAHDQLEIKSLLEFGEYNSLVAFSMFVFGLLFQLPIVMVFLMRIGLVEPPTFRRFRKHAILASFTLAMVLTPPDPISQVALALCMVMLYEIAIVIGSTIARKRDEPEAAE